MRWAWVALGFASAMSAQAQTDIYALLKGSDVRRAEVLAKNPERLTPLVLEVLQNKDPELRRLAAIALRELDAPKESVRESDIPGEPARRKLVVSALTLAARDSNPKVAEEAMLSLLTVLRVREWGIHGEPFEDSVDIKPLKELGEALLPTLSRVLVTSDSDYGVRSTAIIVLKGIKSPQALQVLMEMMPKVGAFLLSDVMYAAVQYDDPRVIPAIVDNIARGEVGDYHDTPGGWVLEEVGRRALPIVLRQLAVHPDAKVRERLVHLLGHIYDDRAVPALIQALSDPESRVRANAADTLRYYEGPSVVQALLRAASDPSLSVRGRAIQVLCVMRAPEAFDTVARALSDPDPYVRKLATRIVRIDRGRAVPLLIPLLHDEEAPPYEEAVRFSAARALSGLPDRRSIPGLLAVLRAREKAKGSVDTEAAAMALAEMDVREAIPILIHLMELRKAPSNVGAVLRRFGPAAADALLGFFPRSGESKKDVIVGLGGTSDPRAIALLQPLAQDKEVGWYAREALERLNAIQKADDQIALLQSSDLYRASEAAKLLGDMRWQAAIDPLVAVLGREMVGAYATAALIKIGDPKVLEAILKKLASGTSGDEKLRWNIVYELGEFRDPRVFALLLNELARGGQAGEAAAHALGRFGDRAALPALRSAATDKKLAEAIRYAMYALTSGDD